MKSLRALASILLASVLVACGPTTPSHRAASARFCPRGNIAMVITEHGFGGLSFDSSLADLQRECPAARDTTLVGYEGDQVALLLPFPGANVMASQNHRDSAEPADTWVIEGDSARMANGLPLRSTWAAIRGAYGNRFFAGFDENNDSVSVGITFCATPHLTFDFVVAAEGPPAHLASADSIPPTVRIQDVGLVRIPDPQVVDACR